jgi:hypothetical protein
VLLLLAIARYDELAALAKVRVAEKSIQVFLEDM